MLGSITPLGERSRGQRFGVTMTAFVVGALAGGAGLGALLGAVGATLGVAQLPARIPLAMLGVTLAIGGILDAGVRGWRLPTSLRQVNDSWMYSYRGWVYGAGFGLQLGAGFATVVYAAATYAAFLAALAVGSAAQGALIGATFALARVGTQLPAVAIRTPADIARLPRVVGRTNEISKTATVAVELAAALACIAFAVAT